MKIKDFYHKKGVEKGVENWISEILDFCLTRETIDFTRFFGERETGFEPATPTLARWCSTSWATRAYNKNYFIELPSLCQGIF